MVLAPIFPVAGRPYSNASSADLALIRLEHRHIDDALACFTPGEKRVLRSIGYNMAVRRRGAALELSRAGHVVCEP